MLCDKKGRGESNIGLRRVELPTSPTPRERATSLRHSPKKLYLLFALGVGLCQPLHGTFDSMSIISYFHRIRAYSSVGRALRWQRRGERFEPA